MSTTLNTSVPTAPRPVAASDQIMDASGAAAILQSVQYGLADQLHAAVDSRLTQVQLAAARLQNALSIAPRLLGRIDPSGKSGQAVLGDDLAASDRLVADMAQAGITVDAPVRYPVVVVNRGKDIPTTYTFKWLTAEQRQAVDAQPGATVSQEATVNLAVVKSPDLGTITGWGTSSPASTERVRTATDTTTTYTFCFDNAANRLVSAAQLRNWAAQMPKIVDGCTHDLSLAQQDIRESLDTYGSVLKSTRDGSQRNDGDAARRVTDNAQRAQRSDQRHGVQLRDQAYPELTTVPQLAALRNAKDRA